jgi:predicted O-linked N-acetylglucosamine transferase (SPINDLY family)
LKTDALADANNQARVTRAFRRHGIAPERIRIADRDSTPEWRSHMAAYDNVDVALDPVGGVFGATTTCDALLVEVPVVTLQGQRTAARMSSSILRAMGADAWIAEDDAGYVATVVELARSGLRHRHTRTAPRGTVARSALCDAPGLATALERTFEDMVDRCTT